MVRESTTSASLDVREERGDRSKAELDPMQARSVEDLKGLGRFREVKTRLQDQLGPRLRVRARSWVELFEATRAIADAARRTPPAEAYFVDPSAEAIFSLLHLDGDPQFRRLGITVQHFGRRPLARAWRDRIARLVHPDRCAHPQASRAMAEVTAIYSAMCEASS